MIYEEGYTGMYACKNELSSYFCSIREKIEMYRFCRPDTFDRRRVPVSDMY